MKEIAHLSALVLSSYYSFGSDFKILIRPLVMKGESLFFYLFVKYSITN